MKSNLCFYQITLAALLRIDFKCQGQIPEEHLVGYSNNPGEI